MSLSISSSRAQVATRWTGGRFLALWSAVVAAALLATGALNVWVDPLGRLGRNTLGIYHSAEFEYKVAQLPAAVFDGILIGSSKIGNIDPDWISRAKLFNAAFSGALPEEMLLLLRANAAPLRGKFVVVGLDFFMFNERTKSIRGDTLVAPTATDVLAYVLSLRSTYFSLQTLMKHARGERALIKVNGARYIDDLLEEDRRLAAPDYGDKIAEILRSLYDRYEFSQRRVEAMRALRRFFESEGIAYAVMLNPQNATLIAATRAAGYGDAFDAYRREMRAVFSDLVDLSVSELSAPAHFFHQSPFYFRTPVMQDMVGRALDVIDAQRRGHAMGQGR